MVAGTFRSGTNLVSHLLSSHYQVAPVFNEWFWKHGLPPTSIKSPLPRNVPVILMSKNPFDHNISLYRFWQSKRPELCTGETFSEFIRKKFIVYDNSRNNLDPKYIFQNPTQYWNQYYFSWLNWSEVAGKIAYAKCEDVTRKPEESLSSIESKLRLKRINSMDVELPAVSVGPTPSKKIQQQRIVLAPEDRDFIQSEIDTKIMTDLGY